MKKIRGFLLAEKNIAKFKELFGWIVSGAIGTILGAVIVGRYIWSAIFTCFIIIVCFIYFKVFNSFSEKNDIYKIIDSEFRSEHYVQVIRMGYTLSRYLHLTGRNELRNKIGYITKKACEELKLEDTIRIENEIKTIASIKIKTLIDDLGWTVFQLGNKDKAIENINDGIKIADQYNEKILQLKGYRHLIGIYDRCEKIQERDAVIASAKKLIEDDDYKNLFTQDEYTHNRAEFDYSVARTLIDDDPERALEMALEVKRIFSDDKTTDMERYVKTFDLIGDIYANYTRFEKLKKAKEIYLEGMKECKKYGRLERLVRISIDYISLLIKMLSSDNTYSLKTWESIDEEEMDVYDTTIKSINYIENKEYRDSMIKVHKEYLKKRKNSRK